MSVIESHVEKLLYCSFFNRLYTRAKMKVSPQKMVDQKNEAKRSKFATEEINTSNHIDLSIDDEAKNSGSDNDYNSSYNVVLEGNPKWSILDEILKEIRTKPVPKVKRKKEK